MKKKFRARAQIFSVALLLTSIIGCVSQPASKIADLFDGKSLQGWNQVGAAKWQAAENQLSVVETSGDGMLVTTESFEDFKLTLEFWVDSRVNSGVFIRCVNNQEISPFNCYEINIWDDHPKQEFRTGSIVMKLFPPQAHVETAGKWNRCKIIAVGNKIVVEINGVRTAELVDNTHKKGVIALQRANAGKVRYRNIRIQQL